MRDKSKKILSLVAAATVLSTAFAFGGCDDYYKNDEILSGVNATDTVASNGGFVVEKGDYVYFINGVEGYTATNTFGEVTKGALMRKKKADLLNADVKAETVVSSLFVEQTPDSGIFIYGDKVYFATPTSTKSTEDGTIQNSWLDFKSAKLDGSATMKDPYFRLKDNAANFRFVEEDGVVYCLYEEDGALKSFNTATETVETLVYVEGSTVTYYYDTNDWSNPVVYYTMDAKANDTTLGYNQIFQVSASAKVTNTDKDKAAYTTSAGYTFTCDKEMMEEANAEAKENKQDEPYNFEDYKTYPYINLGELVLDGIGSLLTGDAFQTQCNPDKTTEPESANGYKYTIVNYASYGEGADKVSGLYFTRVDITMDIDKSLYFLSDAKVDANDWNTVSGNNTSNFVKVASNTTNTANAIFYVEGNNHNYIYVSDDNKLMRMENGAETELADGVTKSTAKFLALSNGYLYYTTGTDLSRIDYTGEAEYYHPLSDSEEYAEYRVLNIPFVNWNSNWYKPEIIGDNLFYCNGDTVNGASYNYVYTASLTNVTEQVASYESAMEEIEELAGDDNDLLAALKYNFKTSKTSAFDAVKDKVQDDAEESAYTQEQKDAFAAYAEDTAKVREGNFICLLGALTDADAEAMEEGWIASLDLVVDTETEEEEEFPVWAIVLIVVGSVLVVGGAVAAVLIVLNKKKQQAEKEDKIANAFKNKIDTTDDKTIDVYADEEPVEEVAETAEEELPAEEVVEETPVEMAEEEAPVAEEVAEEAPVETVEEAQETNE